MFARVVQRSWQPVLTCVAGVGCGVGVGVALKGSWQPSSRQQQQQQQGSGLWGVVACDDEDDNGGRKLSNITSMFTTKPLEKAKVGTSEAGAAVPWTYYVGWGITGLCFGTFIAFNMLRAKKASEGDIVVSKAIQLLERHVDVGPRLGVPITAGSGLKGKIQPTHASGVFDCSGTITKAQVQVTASLAPSNDWLFSQLDVRFQDGAGNTASVVQAIRKQGSSGSRNSGDSNNKAPKTEKNS